MAALQTEALRTLSSTERDLRSIKYFFHRLFGGGDSPEKRGLASTTRIFKLVADLLGEIGKVAIFMGGLCTLLGILMGCSYLLSSGVPLTDATAIAMPTFVAAVTAILSISVFLLIPGVLAVVNGGYIHSARDASFWRRITMFFICYGTAFGLTVSLLIFLTLTLTNTWQPETRLSTFKLVAGVFFLAHIVGGFLAWQKWNSRSNIQSPNLLILLPANIFLGLSITETFQLVAHFATFPDFPDWAQALCCSGAFASLMFFFWWMLWPARGQRQSPIGYAVAVLLLVFFFVPLNWGGVALRFLGVGGNLPVSLSIKETPNGGSTVVAKREYGCLLLLTSSDVFIQPYVARRNCRMEAPSLFSPVPKPPPYQELVRYARADLLTISEYPKIEWIDARSRGQLGLAERPSDTTLIAEIQYRKQHGFSKTYSVEADDNAFENDKKLAQGQMTYSRVSTIPNRGVPSPKDREAFLNLLDHLRNDLKNGTANSIIEGDRVDGRASFFAVCILAAKGMKSDEAVDSISTLLGRPAIDTDDQKEFVNQVAQHFASAKRP